MSKRYLLAGASALMLALAMPMPSMAQTSTVMTMPYSVAAVQRALNDLGYSAGPVDGLMGGKKLAAPSAPIRSTTTCRSAASRAGRSTSTSSAL